MLVLITCPPAVIVTCNVLNTPAGVPHATLLSDAHPVDSPAVMPTAADIVCPCSPSPDPITIISSPPGSITFDVPSTDTTPPSADTVPVADPIASPDVTDTRLLPDPDRPTTHTTAVSDTHAVPSHPVSPTLPASVIEYPRMPDTIIVMLSAPVAGPFHRPIELPSPASAENIFETDPMR